MARCMLFFGVVSLVLAYVAYQVLKDETPPKEFPKFYWGGSNKKQTEEDTSIKPFSIQVAEGVLTDLKNRLRIETGNTSRLAAPLEGIAFQYGFNTQVLPKITEYWLNKYDWRSREKMLNKYTQFTTSIDGLSIHFQHIKSESSKKYKTTVPLLLLHGWPGSFVEFQKMIPLLVNPKDSELNFELVIPSLPGYGFSEGAHVPGLGPTGMAQINLKLMKRLGYENFYIQAGDWGSIVASHMATYYPNNVKGLHLNMCNSRHPRSFLKMLIASIKPTWFMDEDQAERLFPLPSYLKRFVMESGYFHLQATKPDTLGIAISNSPSGLAGYILEKFVSATNGNWIQDPTGGILSYYSVDELIDNLMMYWVTNSFPTAIRLYAEAFTEYEMSLKMDKVPIIVPTACFQAPYEFLALQNEWMLKDRYQQIFSFTKVTKGGHFAAFEIPELLAKDVLTSLSKLEHPGPKKVSGN